MIIVATLDSQKYLDIYRNFLWTYYARYVRRSEILLALQWDTIIMIIFACTFWNEFKNVHRIYKIFIAKIRFIEIAKLRI